MLLIYARHSTCRDGVYVAFPWTWAVLWYPWPTRLSSISFGAALAMHWSPGSALTPSSFLQPKDAGASCLSLISVASAWLASTFFRHLGNSFFTLTYLHVDPFRMVSVFQRDTNWYRELMKLVLPICRMGEWGSALFWMVLLHFGRVPLPHPQARMVQQNVGRLWSAIKKWLLQMERLFHLYDLNGTINV